MAGILRSLPDIYVEESAPDALPDVHPKFFISRLPDKPQNPIMETLRINLEGKKCSQPLPASLNATRIKTVFKVPELEGLETEDSVWQQASLQTASDHTCIMSWDALRPTFDTHTSPPPFLSQQSVSVFASVWHHVRPPLRDASTQIINTSAERLMHSLRMMLTGTTSSLYYWNTEQETFELRGIENNKRGVVVITGKDETASASIVKRFVTIGTLVRRLERLVSSRQLNHKDPVHHAFIYALSTILAFLRQSVLSNPILFDDDRCRGTTIAATWIHYAQLEESLQALSALCQREEHISPGAYTSLPYSSPELLSSVYNYLNDHIERKSAKHVVALFAYILTTTSQAYMVELSRSVGFGSTYTRSHFSRYDYQSSILTEHGDLEDQYGPTSDQHFEDDNSFPCFIEHSVAGAIMKARGALKLLRIAQQDHPLLRTNSNDSEMKWVWTAHELDRLSQGHAYCRHEKPQETGLSVIDGGLLESHSYRVGLEAFRVFDTAPGSHFPQDSTNPLFVSSATVFDLHRFIENFPHALPSMTPTLSHVTSLVLSPLIRHINALSDALVSVLLSPSTYFHLRTHLTLVRSYLLLTSPSFKSRVTWALFSSSEDFDAVDTSPRDNTTRRARSYSQSRPDGRNRQIRWAVGLARSLTKTGTWPPAGADLSFHLRTVIIDSLEDGRSHNQATESNEKAPGSEKIMEEAEWRLGFAIRDLPVGTGREKWLNPLSIEALDFLYMDYKPPPPLDTIFTPEVLSKYHRIFAFNLRLLRVENALAALYRMTRKSSNPLFPTFASSNKALLHFRFVAHSFVTSLASYVYDTAIGSTFDELVARASSSEDTARDPNFADIYAISEYHSAVLDDILSACLLRSGQKAVGDLLRSCLEHVLELCILAGDLSLGLLEEYEAAPLLEDMWKTFSKKMTTLVEVLKGLVEKGSSSSSYSIALEEFSLQGKAGIEIVAQMKAAGVTGKWHSLLVRLDVANWWIHRFKARSV